VWEAPHTEELTLQLLELFIMRLCTPEIELWPKREGVLLQDSALMIERLRHNLLPQMVALDADEDEDDGYVTA